MVVQIDLYNNGKWEFPDTDTYSSIEDAIKAVKENYLNSYLSGNIALYITELVDGKERVNRLSL